MEVQVLRNHRVTKMGLQRFFNIPKRLFDSGVINVRKRYDISIKESDDDAKNNAKKGKDTSNTGL